MLCYALEYQGAPRQPWLLLLLLYALEASDRHPAYLCVFMSRFVWLFQFSKLLSLSLDAGALSKRLLLLVVVMVVAGFR